jgi:polysaccharide pyruvyl transferase WcaK-like protein
MKIVFDGGYTIWSAGDDAPLGFLLDRFRKVLPADTEYVVLARHPSEEFEKYFGVKTVHNLEHETKKASIGRWFNGLNFSDDRNYIKSIVDEIRTANLLILGAGNFLTEVGLDVLRGHLSRFSVLTLIAQLFDVKVMLFGLSANKLTNVYTRAVAQWLLNNADAVTFREEEAIRDLIYSGISLPPYTLLPDAAIGAPQPLKGRGREILKQENIPLERFNRLAISIRDMSWRGADIHNWYLNETAKLINLWNAREKHDVIFIPQCSYDVGTSVTDDRFWAAKIKELTDCKEKVHIVTGQYQYEDIESLYDEADITVATRLHGNVFSALRGTPVVGLAYENKVRGFYERINMLDLCLPFESKADDILIKLDEVQLNRAQVLSKLSSELSRLTNELDGYIEIALNLLT